MKYSVIRGVPVVRALDEPIAGASAAMELIASLRYETDCEKVVLSKACLDESFFRLSSGLAGEVLAVIMTLGTLSFLVTTPEVWVPDLGSGEFGFPLLSGAGRLVIKDTAILAGALVLLSDTARKLLARRREA